MKDPSRFTSDSHDEPMPDVTRPSSSANSGCSHPMPDCSRPQSLASTRPVSWYTENDSIAIRVAHLDSGEENTETHRQVSESLFDDLMGPSSPRQFSANSGISAPSNTRVNSAASTPARKTSTAAELRGMPRSVSITIRDPPTPFTTFVPPDNSVNPSSNHPRSASRQLELHVNDEIGEESENKAKKRPVGRPAGHVKSRKEGQSSEMGLEAPSSKSQRRVSASSASAPCKENSGGANREKSGEGKRKRAAKVDATKGNCKDKFDNPDSSPTRKVSKQSPEDTTHPKNEIE